jgi:hypothetical protein
LSCNYPESQGSNPIEIYAKQASVSEDALNFKAISLIETFETVTNGFE